MLIARDLKQASRPKRRWPPRAWHRECYVIARPGRKRNLHKSNTHHSIMKSAILSFLALTFPAHAISIAAAGSDYTQNFDGLATSGTTNTWANGVTLPGWSLFRQPIPGSAIKTYSAGTGTSNDGSFYSYGATGSDERALGALGTGTYFGSPASGAIAGWMAVSFSNGSGGIFDGFEVSWDGEQWRNGGNTSTQTMVFQYGFGANFTDVSIWWTPGGLFDFTSVVNSVPAGAVVGNSAGFVDGRGGFLCPICPGL